MTDDVEREVAEARRELAAMRREIEIMRVACAIIDDGLLAEVLHQLYEMAAAAKPRDGRDLTEREAYAAAAIVGVLGPAVSPDGERTLGNRAKVAPGADASLIDRIFEWGWRS
jgi:hypothetical protein